MSEANSWREKKTPRVLAAGAALAFGSIACSSGGGNIAPAPVTVTVAPPEQTGSALPPKKDCDFAKGNEVKLGQAVWVQAGAVRLPTSPSGTEYQGHLVYNEDGSKLRDLAANEKKPNIFTLDGGIAVKGLQKFARGPLNITKDACSIPRGVTRPALDAQAVTVTSTVELTDGGDHKATLPSFGDFNSVVGNSFDAYNQGAIGVGLSNQAVAILRLAPTAS